ncbi:cytochrome P450 [Sphingomonas sp. PP-F2F-A104-K0414]|uniref:cytochrome P450 n=1 Tax=Sphingomonas sp. PP-F2F-A104-K0414 TaxID=2135661 RepID=UPI00105336A6|nr:cytochrome P450 [Sphingomonas sp. PP-F2F-A104-K0414]TCP98925.1 cytochrome P450 [Sphingomonas sp. PP-F2F-A104-K0414]
MSHAMLQNASAHWLPRQRKGALDHIPGNYGLPFVGNTFKLLADPIAFSETMAARYGPVYRNRALGGTGVNLLGPDANELVLFDRDKIFSSEQGWGPVLNLLFPRGLMLMDFDKHRADRRTLSVAFKPEPMRHYATELDTGIEAAIGGWAGQTLRFYDVVKKLTLDLAATSFLGVPLGAEADRINQAFVDEVQASVSPIRKPWPGTQMRKGVKARAYLVDFFEREIPARRTGNGQDFFSQFCRATDDDGAPLSALAIADHMNFLMMAAHDTITSSATSLVMLLARNPEWQERLREEVAALDTALPLTEQLDRLILTEYAFKESLRMMPPVPSIPRRALKDFSFGGYDIPAGTSVGTAITYTHRMAEYWPDPERFDPLRFTPEASKGRHRFAWVPFGGGAHMCIGLHFATMQMRLLIAHLLTRYRIEAAAGSGDAWQVFPIPRPKDGLPVTFVPLATP